MITIQHKTTFRKKQVDVREWLGYSAWQAEQYTIIQVSQIVKLFYNQRYLGLHEDAEVQHLLENKQYWIVRDLNAFDYFNLGHRTFGQRLRGLMAAITGRYYLLKGISN